VTDERREQIIRLLETRDDHLPSPTRRDYSTAGFKHNNESRVSCPDCLTNDRRMFGCETCGGRGYLLERRKVDPYATDQEVKPYGFDGSYIEGIGWRDREIDLMSSQLAPPRTEADLLEEANQHPYGWELARERMYEQFDYRAVDLALEALRDADGSAYHALHGIYVYRWVKQSAGHEAACARGLAFLDERLPHPLRAPKEEQDAPVLVGKLERGAGASVRELRDGQIRQLASDGLDPASIAKQCHVSIRTVYNVVSTKAA
jgi:hypothetical protein